MFTFVLHFDENRLKCSFFFKLNTIKYGLFSSYFIFLELIQMDLQDQLKKLFPEHQLSNDPEEVEHKEHTLFIQTEPIICKYEKRKGKPTTIIEGYEGSDEDFKLLAKELKTKLSVGGTFKDSAIIIQGDYRDKIMNLLKDKGFKVKRVGG